MTGQYINKVVYDGNTLIDLTEDTVTPATLAVGATAHSSRGNVIIGEAELVDLLNEYEKILYFGAFSDYPTTDGNFLDNIAGSMTSFYDELNTTMFKKYLLRTWVDENSITRELTVKKLGSNNKTIGTAVILPGDFDAVYQGLINDLVIEQQTEYEINIFDPDTGELKRKTTFIKVLKETGDSIQTRFNNYNSVESE